MLELYELQIFLIAAETENFSETARILNLSQSAVSAHIQTLEEKLGIRLFDRVGRSIRLSDIGEAAVPGVRKLLRDATCLEEMISSQRGELQGTLTLGCSTAAGKYILPKIMARFMTCYPNVRTVCRVGPRDRALESLTAGEVDLAVSSLRVPRQNLEYQHFADDQLVLIVPKSHVWAQRDRLKPENLVEHHIVLRESSSGTSITLNRDLSKYDLNVEMLQTRLVLENTEAIIQAACEGVGPAFVSHIAALNVLREGLVVEVPVEGLRLVQKLYMARNTDFRAHEARAAFWDFVFAPENADLRPLVTET
ncbi:MAG TPA: LysR family transcriptional regulator [Aggregatilineaceae bacterium]|nr:LysR family transcriptional regulator [Aggregatilineaceae bacterium]